MQTTYVSALAWVSRGFARHMPRDSEINPLHIQQIKDSIHAEMPPQDAEWMEDVGMDQDDKEYPQQIEELSDEQIEDFVIKPTDALIAAGKVEKEFSTVEVYIFQQEKNNLYVHHQLQLSAFPLALEWLGHRSGVKTNLLVVSTFLPQIQLWDLDSLNEVEPIAILGGQQKVHPKKVRKLKEGKKSFKKNSHHDAVLSLSHNPCAPGILASGSADYTTKIWDLESCECLETFKNHYQKVEVVRWNPAEKEAILSVSSDGLINIFDARNPGSGISTRIGMQVEDSQWNVSQTHQFAIGGEQGQLALLDARKLAEPLLCFKGHHKQVSGVDFSINHVLVTSGFDGMVKVWDCLSGNLLTQDNAKSGRLFSMRCYQDDRRVMAAGTEKGDLYVWDMQENELLKARFSS